MADVVLITGCSSGVGLNAVVLFARHGFRVVATMRSLAKSEPLRAAVAAATVEVDIMELDVSVPASIERCLAAIYEKYGRIDVLVNNAGQGALGIVDSVSDEALRQCMEVNFFGVWNLTRAVFPKMRDAGKGRIIDVSSVGGVIGQPFNDAYCAAKFAVEGLIESLAPVARKFNVYCSVVEPGPIKTEFVSNVSKPASLAECYVPYINKYMAATQEAFKVVGQTGEEVAQVLLKAATDEKPQLRYPTSERIAAITARKLVDPTGESVVALSGARLE